MAALLPLNTFRLLVILHRHKPAARKVMHVRPLDKLDLSHKHRLQQSALHIFAVVDPAPNSRLSSPADSQTGIRGSGWMFLQVAFIPLAIYAGASLPL
jgi:hypothetical protein